MWPRQSSRRPRQCIEVQPQAPGLQDRQDHRINATKVIWAIHNVSPLTAPSVGSGNRATIAVDSEPAAKLPAAFVAVPGGLAARFNESLKSVGISWVAVARSGRNPG